MGAFGILDGKYFSASANVTKVGRTYLGELIVSNVKAIIQQQQQIFNLFWDIAIPAKQRIKEIEQGFKREFIDIIRDPIDILSLIFKVLKTTTDELQILFSSFNAFQKLEYLGVIETVKELVLEYGIKIRILVNIEKEDESSDTFSPCHSIFGVNIGVAVKT